MIKIKTKTDIKNNAGIHNGNKTQNQLHVIILSIFNTIKPINNKLNPMPEFFIDNFNDIKLKFITK